MIDRIKISDLKLFCEVVESGGMTQAAQKLGHSQPGLSRTMRELELKLNARLLNRTGRGVELTRAGEVFYRFCTRTLDDFQTSKKKIKQLAYSMPKQLDIAIPLHTSSLLTPVLLRVFQQYLPTIAVYIYEDTTQRIADDIVKGMRDFALVYQPPISTTYSPIPIARESLYLVGQQEKIGVANKPIRLEELAKLPLLLPSHELHYRRLIDASFHKKGIVPNVVRELETVDALLAFAMEGEGVTILAYSNVYQQVDRGEIAVRQIISPSIDRQICLIFSKDIDRFTLSKIRKIIRQTLGFVSQSCRWTII